MPMPTIHLNGTHPKDLYSQAENVAQKARELFAALAEAAPNGRDYYPQGPTATTQALSDHELRLDSVRAINKWAEAIMEAASERM